MENLNEIMLIIWRQSEGKVQKTEQEWQEN